MRVAELVFLNGTRTRFRVDDSLPVARILQTVGSKLGLTPSSISEYGLKFGGQLSEGLGDKDVLRSGWLDPQLSLQQHGVKSSTRLELKWLKRFFVSDHCISTADEVALHYSFLECRNAFLTDALDTSGHGVIDVAQSAACLLHVDHGRFEKKKHTQQWYAGKRYVPESWIELCGFVAVAAAWKQLGDDVAPKKTFVDLCRKFPGFACTFFENVTLDGKAEVQVALSMERVVINDTRRLKTKAKVAAAAASPRTADDNESAPVDRKMSLLRTSSSGVRRGSILHASREESVNDEGASGTGGEGDAQSPSAVTGTSPASAGGGAGEMKSPRGGILARTFTLRRDKKASSPNLNNLGSSDGGSVADRNAVKSGRFKSFTGLGLLKRGNTKIDLDVSVGNAAPVTGPDSSPGQAGKDEKGASSSSQSVGFSDDGSETTEERSGGTVDMEVTEGRMELHSVPLEELARWGLRGNVVLLEVVEVGNAMASKLMELRFSTSDVATEFSELLLGYCAFRLEDESPAVFERATVEKTSNVAWSAVGGVLALRPYALHLVSEVALRARMRWEAAPLRPVEAATEMNRLFGAVASLLSTGAGSATVMKVQQCVASVLASLPSEFESSRAAVESLSLALGCAFPADADDEQSASAALDGVRERAILALCVCTAFSNSMLACRMESAVASLDKLLDLWIGPLEEASRRPSAPEPHSRLARIVQQTSPRFAEAFRAAKVVSDIAPGSGAIVQACSRLSRDILSELLLSCALLSDSFSGSAEETTVDKHVKTFLELEARLRRMKDVAGVPLAALKRAIALALQCCLKAARCTERDALSTALEPAIIALDAVAALEPSTSTRRNVSTVSASERAGPLVWMLADAIPILAFFVSEMYFFLLLLFFFYFFICF